MEERGKDKQQLVQAQIQTKRKKRAFYWLIENKLPSNVGNNKTTKTTEQDKKVNENKRKRCKNNHNNSLQVK